MSKGNSIAGLLIGLYLASVALNGRVPDLWAQLREQQDFLKWIGAWLAFQVIKGFLPRKIGWSLDLLLGLGMAISLAASDPESLSRARAEIGQLLKI